MVTLRVHRNQQEVVSTSAERTSLLPSPALIFTRNLRVQIVCHFQEKAISSRYSAYSSLMNTGQPE